MELGSTPLQLRQITYRYGLTTWQIRNGRETGFIGAIVAPTFVKKGSRYLASRHQMDVFQARRKEWHRLFLNSPRMTAFIGSPFAGVESRKNWDARRIAQGEPYLSIIPPGYYLFEGCRGTRYWHLEDLQLFRRFLDGVFDRRLLPYEHPNYDPVDSVFRPNYPSPPDFPERYTEETRLRVLGDDDSSQN